MMTEILRRPHGLERRRLVEDWALANTDPRLMLAAIPGNWGHRLWRIDDDGFVVPGLRDPGAIWLAFVLHTVAAAQDDEWIDDQHIWPTIERNIGMRGSDFLAECDPHKWSRPASYMEPFERIYRAGPTPGDSPVWIHDGELVAPGARLIAGAARARRIVYGADW